MSTRTESEQGVSYRAFHGSRSANGACVRAADPLAGDRRRVTNLQCGSTAATEPRRGRPQARWSTVMDGELGVRGGAPRERRGDPPAAAVRGAEHLYWHTRHASLPGCRSPPAPVAAQVADPRAAAMTERPASGREARPDSEAAAPCLCRVRVDLKKAFRRGGAGKMLKP